MSGYWRKIMDRRQFVLSGGAMLAMSGKKAVAQESFPSRAVRLVVPFTPGGPTDVIARVIGEAMSVKWSVPVIVDNKPGAGTMIGTDAVAKSTPDGHVVGVVITAHVINPAVRDKMPFDAQRDLRGITQLAEAHMVVVANPAFEADDIPGLVRLAKQASQPLAYATPGPATATHMAAELLQKVAEIKMLHVPYNGSANALTDVLAQRVPLMFDVWHSVQQHVQDKTLKVIGVTNATPIPNAPQYKRIAETYPGYEANSMFGLVVPSKTPDQMVKALSRDVSAFVKSPEFAAKAASFGMQPIGSSPAEFDDFIDREIKKWRDIAGSANIRIN
ncbi:tripartite tricarboxylate transporter substrate binding protein [Tardiphaga alba]|uniref:Tripartite tricarboxylate transporter substrate binding protein n=1 Tax=Tardiphaga alba TaxID=340268 RepID=A0ABX8AEJ4_9BRAD|nr:tripartite tricarboxylate transporter substrate binding protein [Tardiphaga alba]QUS41949.1 tripartite tricarboxylate transporter substrate binding protein [Tardiphaga alba]